ncbi:MAG: OmpH family outer membrane protein [Bacteroidetes bacterium]|uniref:OmpH family outer membrane protein n=1 Tax=Candidatus Pullibacteroides excrementavium TaxID=2840905 RepID=A0A9D9DSB8_9BACT|nr:OmpH family outer membrane protein [Candidatus Pullibacteroides excrementavium]
MRYNFLKISLLSLACGLLATACASKDGNAPTPVSSVSSAAVPSASGTELRIAIVNMDSINNGFQMVADIQRELASTEEKLSKDIQDQGSRWQKDYDNYLQVGATMTLNEQHRKEDELTRRQQELATLQQTYANQIVSLQAQRLQEVTDYILAYIEEYNQDGRYSLILSSGNMSGVLYRASTMDITSDILNGLNQKYAAEKAKK